MAGLKAVISADANPFKEEIARVEKTLKQLKARAGGGIAEAAAGGSAHGGRSGIIRESLVLVREISRGNWTRVPGSLSLLAQYMGVFGGATAVTVGLLGTFVAILAGVAAGAAIAYGRFTALSKALRGLELPDFKTEYIAKHLQAINQVAEGWKQIAIEVRKATENYNSAENAAKRAADASKEHFEHLRKMNAFEKDPVKKANAELEIDRQERKNELDRKASEMINLDVEGRNKKAQADKIDVSSKEHDDQLIKKTKADADAAEKFLKEHKMFGTTGDKAKAALFGGLLPGQAQGAFDAMKGADAASIETAQRAIQSHKEAVDRAASNDELRKRKEELTKQAGESFGKAKTMGLDMPRLQAELAQKNADEAAETAARLAGQGKTLRGSVNNLQQVGAYAAPAQVELIGIHRQQLGHLKSIDSKLGKVGGGTGNMGKVRY